MDISITLTGDEALLLRFSQFPAVAQAALFKKMETLTLLLEGRVKQKLSGEVLNVGKNRPGHTGGQLRASISHKVEMQGTAVIGTVFSSGDVKYARIQEYGGRTAAHIIAAKRASVLAYIQNGEKRFARFVHHPGSTMPERSYMRSSLRELSDEISLGMKAAVVDALRSKK